MSWLVLAMLTLLALAPLVALALVAALAPLARKSRLPLLAALPLLARPLRACACQKSKASQLRPNCAVVQLRNGELHLRDAVVLLQEVLFAYSLKRVLRRLLKERSHIRCARP